MLVQAGQMVSLSGVAFVAPVPNARFGSNCPAARPFCLDSKLLQPGTAADVAKNTNNGDSFKRLGCYRAIEGVSHVRVGGEEGRGTGGALAL